MVERFDPILKKVCIVLGVLLVFQFGRALLGGGPLDDLHFEKSVALSDSAGEPSGDAAAAAASNLQVRVEQISKSEILGQIPKPPPMALIGIAGEDVILRAPNGQSGMIRVGEELGGVKLLRFSTNRAVVEVEGEEKELTIFSGLGSETMLPPPQEPPK